MPLLASEPKYLRRWIPILSGFVSMALLCFSTQSFAEAAPETHFWGLQNCLSRVQTQSVQVAQSVVAETQAKAALKEATQPRLPQIVGQEVLAYAMDPTILSPDSNQAMLRVELGTLPFFGSAWRLADQKRAELETSKLTVIESVQDVQLLVKQLYFSILRDEDIIASLDQVQKQFDRLVATVIPKFQIGHAPQFDVVKVRSATYDLERTRDLVRSQWVGEKSQLNEILRLGGQDFELFPLHRLPDLHTVRKDLESNPTLAVLQQEIDAADSAVSVAKAQRIPSLSAAFGFGYEGLTPTTMVPQWVTLAQFRVPIFDWGLISSQVEQAQAATVLAQKRLEAESQKTQADYDQTVALAEAHLADDQRLENLLPQLRRSAQVSVDRYRVAGMGIIEVTDAINLWLQGLINQKTAYYDYLADLAKLERLSGESTVRYE